MSNSQGNRTSAEREKIKKAILELEGSFTRVAAERDLQKAILQKALDDLGMDKKILRKMAKTYYNGSFAVEQVEQEEFETAYQEVMGE